MCMFFYIGIEAEPIYEAGSLLRKRKYECESGVEVIKKMT